jgi:hypothetical protein
MKPDRPSAPPSAKPEESAKPPLFHKAKSWIEALYRRYEKYTELTIFGVGFIWDSFTMTRVDSLIDNIILLFYITIIGTMIVLTLRRHCGVVLPKWILKIEPRFPWAMQFCFGGLFSSYVIFYFKSASWTRTQFFFLILIFLWIGNEFLKHRLRNPILLSVLYSFCLFSFLAFFLPVVLAKVNAGIFAMAGLISLVVSLSVFSIGLRAEPREWRRRMKPIVPWIAATYLVVNLLYFGNLIPPVPLALKSAGIYHQITRTRDGYVVKYVPPSWLHFWRKSDDPFYWSQGESVYCYTAIFAPGRVRVPILHVWSCKTEKGWKQKDKIRFEIAGGREGGYRGFSKKNRITPGEWRVDVMTEGGQILGRLDFTAADSPYPHPALKTMLIR